ncbi:hypothetical protein MCT08_16820 [Vibrio aestuarianus]|uniref:hypothetical protein n=1 Tax=Vibrio aestuarianus TaxID=28171 RepID=UPI00237D10BF|nr:hypothetical protein [Vibrio aestuarianus]MDE1251232.1 hypothetical protein [Vibrio aestuarianus]
MLQTNFLQVTNGEFQLVTKLLLRETQRGGRPVNEALPINLPLPHFAPVKLATNQY